MESCFERRDLYYCVCVSMHYDYILDVSSPVNSFIIANARYLDNASAHARAT